MDFCNVYSASSFENCLQNLDLKELLILQRSLEGLNEISSSEDPTLNLSNSKIETFQEKCSSNLGEKCSQPKTMALVDEKKRHLESDWHNDSLESYELEEKPSKLQTLFQISVTALSFLSFGGYLLCLIVQSIRNRGNSFFVPLPTPTIPIPTTNVRRIKVYRRSKAYPQSTRSLPTQSANHQPEDTDNFQYPDPYWYHQPKSKKMPQTASTSSKPLTIIKL